MVSLSSNVWEGTSFLLLCRSHRVYRMVGRRVLQAVEMGWDNIPGIYYRGLGTDCSMAHCDPIVMCTEWGGTAVELPQCLILARLSFSARPRRQA